MQNITDLRYERHIKLIDVKKLKETAVLVIGVGGLGCPVAEILTRCGIGKLYLIDKGIIDEPDLNRQILYTQKDIGKKKVEVATKRLKEISPETEIIPIFKEVSSDFEIPQKISVIAVCVDNFKTRYIIDDLAHKYNIPYVHTGVKELYGQITTIVPQETVRLKEIFPNVPQEEKIPVHPAAVISIASLQAAEVINLILKKPKLKNKLLLVDINDFSIQKIDLK